MKLKILGKTYSVEFVAEEALPKDYGECNDVLQVIKVRTDLHPETQADVLLHEVIHAIDFGCNLKLTEHQVHSLATGLLGVMLDNKELTECLNNPNTIALKNVSP